MLSPSSSLHCTSKLHINCLINSTLGQFKVTSENELHFGQSRPSTLTKIEGWVKALYQGFRDTWILTYHWRENYRIELRLRFSDMDPFIVKQFKESAG